MNVKLENILDPEGGCSVYRRNIGTYVHNYTELHPRRFKSLHLCGRRVLFYPEGRGSTFLRTIINLSQTTHCHIPENDNLCTLSIILLCQGQYKDRNIDLCCMCLNKHQVL